MARIYYAGVGDQDRHLLAVVLEGGETHGYRVQVGHDVARQ